MFTVGDLVCAIGIIACITAVYVSIMNKLNDVIREIRKGGRNGTKGKEGEV